MPVWCVQVEREGPTRESHQRCVLESAEVMRWPSMDPSERKEEPKRCMAHQDIAKVLGLPDYRQFGDDEIGHFKSLGGVVTTIKSESGQVTYRPIGYALTYTGNVCPLCYPQSGRPECHNVWHALSYEGQSDRCPTCKAVRHKP